MPGDSGRLPQGHYMTVVGHGHQRDSRVHTGCANSAAGNNLTVFGDAFSITSCPPTGVTDRMLSRRNNTVDAGESTRRNSSSAPAPHLAPGASILRFWK